MKFRVWGHVHVLLIIQEPQGNFYGIDTFIRQPAPLRIEPRGHGTHIQKARVSLP